MKDRHRPQGAYGEACGCGMGTYPDLVNSHEEEPRQQCPEHVAVGAPPEGSDDHD